MDANYQRAIDLLTSAKVRRAFDLTKEPDELRSRYGGGDKHIAVARANARAFVEGLVQDHQVALTHVDTTA